MLRGCLLLFIVMYIFSCKESKENLDGTGPVDVKDFMSAFHTLSIPATFSDTALLHIGDTTHISYTVLSQFVADSSITNAGLHVQNPLIIQPAGKIEKAEEIYLLVKISQAKKSLLFVFVFDKKKQVSCWHGASAQL